MILPFQDYTLIISIAVCIGLISMIVARRLNVPGIVVLLISGVIIGPDVANVIDPKILGGHLQKIVGTAVAIILFEGGLQLKLASLRKHQTMIRRLVTSGVVLTAVGASLVAYFILRWEWQLCVLFSTLVIVTGPTVVSPLLKRIRVQKDVHSILHAEGILIDPVGALIAVIAFDVIASGSALGAASGFFDLIQRLGFGALIGLVFGSGLAWLLKRPNLVPDEYNNTLTLGFILFIFHGSNQFFHESGIMATTIAGMTLGNAKLPTRRNMIEFKEQLTNLLIGMLFILLTANTRLSDVKALGWPGLFTVLGLIFLVRPLVILYCAKGSKLNFRKKIFMAWLGPRGIVAAAVTSLFATRMKNMGMEGGDRLQALVFLVIAVTVILQGLTADLFAGLLKVRLPRDDGFVLIGVNPFSLAIAHHLAQTESDIVFIDKNSDACATAEEEGYRVIYGNAMDGSVLKRARVSTRRGVIAMTDNEGVNLEALRKCYEISRDLPLFIVQSAAEIKSSTLQTLHIQEAFASRIDIAYWNYIFDKEQGYIVKLTLEDDLKEDGSKELFSALKSFDAVPILTQTEKGSQIFTSYERSWKKGVVLTLCLNRSAERAILERFAAKGWRVEKIVS